MCLRLDEERQPNFSRQNSLFPGYIFTWVACSAFDNLKVVLSNLTIEKRYFEVVDVLKLNVKNSLNH